MPGQFLASVCTRKMLSPLLAPLVLDVTEDDSGGALSGIFTVQFGDGRVDIQVQSPPEPARFTVTTGDSLITVVP